MGMNNPARLCTECGCTAHKRTQRGFVIPSIEMIAFGAAAVFAVTTFLFYSLYSGAVDEYLAYRTQVEAQSEAVRLENERKLRALAEANRQLDSDFAAARRELDRRGRVIRVQPNRCEGILPTVPTAVEGLNATAEARTVSAEQCEALLNDGIADAQQVMFLQRWILDAHEATR